MKTLRRILSFLIGIFTIICMPLIILWYIGLSIVMSIYYIGVGVHQKVYEKLTGKKI